MSLILIYQLYLYFRAINLPLIKIKRSFFRIIKKLMTVYVFLYLGFTVCNPFNTRIKGSTSVILSDHICKDDNALFTKVPSKPLSDQV